MSITKNNLSDEIVIRIFRKNFPERTVSRIDSLSEGMLNAVFRVTMDDGGRYILKVAPQSREGMMSNEVNLMRAELRAMEIMRGCGYVTVPKAYAFDGTKVLCGSEYFIMDCLDGENLMFACEKLSEEQLSAIYREIGVIQRRMSDIHYSSFGLLGDDRRFDRLYDFVRTLIGNVLSDAHKMHVETGVDEQAVLARLDRDSAFFDEVGHSSLVHWDMWEGNIFVQNGHVSGIIDWERAMYGEPYMDDRFRKHSIKEAFLLGYGKSSFSDSEKRRMRWYDLLLYLTMMTEAAYRQYEDDGQYRWAKPLCDSAWNDIKA